MCLVAPPRLELCALRGNLAGIPMPALEGPNAAGHKRVPSPSPPAEGALTVAPVGLARHPPKH